MIIIEKLANVSDQEYIITSEKLMLLSEMQKPEVQIPETNHNTDLSLNLFIRDWVLKWSG